MMQILLGKKLLLPLKESFIPTFRDYLSDATGAVHGQRSTSDRHH